MAKLEKTFGSVCPSRTKKHAVLQQDLKNRIFSIKCVPDVQQKTFIYKFAKKVYVVSLIQYNIICEHMARFFFFRMKKNKIAQKHAVLQQDLKLKK